jgi:rod shape-determining protein MreD
VIAPRRTSFPAGALPQTPLVRYVLFTFVVAFCLNVLPWGGTLLLLRPDFLLLVLLYWCMREPRMVGQTIGLLCGLVMDVADSAVLGQHAFVYVLAVYAAFTLRLRILRFPLPQQALHMVLILLVADLVTVLLNLIVGAPFPGYSYFVGGLIGAALWPSIVWLLELPEALAAQSELP